MDIEHLYAYDSVNECGVCMPLRCAAVRGRTAIANLPLRWCVHPLQKTKEKQILRVRFALYCKFNH